jgi:hypothetical protein
MNARHRQRNIPGLAMGRIFVVKLDPLNMRWHLETPRVRSKKYNGGKRIAKPIKAAK